MPSLPAPFADIHVWFSLASEGSSHVTGPWSCLESHSWRQGKHFPLASASFGPLGKKVQRPLGCLGLGPGPAASWFLVVPEGPPCKVSPPSGGNGSAFCCCCGSVNGSTSSGLGGSGAMEGGDPSYVPGTSPLRTVRLLEAETLSYSPAAGTVPGTQ